MSGHEFIDRSGAYHDRLTSVSADVAGVLREPIVGPLIDTDDPMRKVYAAFTHCRMPAKGQTFEKRSASSWPTSSTSTPAAPRRSTLHTRRELDRDELVGRNEPRR